MNVIHKSYSLYHTIIDITVESVAVIFAGGLQSSRYEDLAAIFYSLHGAIRQGSGGFRPSDRIFVKGAVDANRKVSHIYPWMCAGPMPHTYTSFIDTCTFEF